MFGPSKSNDFSFSQLFGNFVQMYTKQCPCLSKAVTNCFIIGQVLYEEARPAEQYFFCFTSFTFLMFFATGRNCALEGQRFFFQWSLYTLLSHSYRKQDSFKVIFHVRCQ